MSNVLTEKDFHSGYKRPYRNQYYHTTCRTVTTLNEETAKTFARNPRYYKYTYCAHCRDTYHVIEFQWLDGNIVGT